MTASTVFFTCLPSILTCLFWTIFLNFHFEVSLVSLLPIIIAASIGINVAIRNKKVRAVYYLSSYEFVRRSIRLIIIELIITFSPLVVIQNNTRTAFEANQCALLKSVNSSEIAITDLIGRHKRVLNATGEIINNVGKDISMKNKANVDKVGDFIERFEPQFKNIESERDSACYWPKWDRCLELEAQMKFIREVRKINNALLERRNEFDFLIALDITSKTKINETLITTLEKAVRNSYSVGANVIIVARKVLGYSFLLSSLHILYTSMRQVQWYSRTRKILPKNPTGIMILFNPYLVHFIMLSFYLIMNSATTQAYDTYRAAMIDSRFSVSITFKENATSLLGGDVGHNVATQINDTLLHINGNNFYTDFSHCYQETMEIMSYWYYASGLIPIMGYILDEINTLDGILLGDIISLALGYDKKYDVILW